MKYDHVHENLREYHPACGGCILEGRRGHPEDYEPAAYYTGTLNLFKDPQTNQMFSVTGIGAAEGERVELMIGPPEGGASRFLLTPHAAELLSEELARYAKLGKTKPWEDPS